jgi:glycosyltransferase involved in cell wall biosynthesis
MTRIRVLHILPSFATGGAERLVVHLMNSLEPRGIEVAALSLYSRQGTELEELLSASRLHAEFLNKRPGPDLRIFGQVWQTIRNFKPDIVHTHLHALNYAVPALLKSAAPRAVHTVHSVAERERRRIGKWLPKMLFSRRITPVAIASEVQDSIHRVYGVKSVLIPNGIPVSAYRPQQSDRGRWRQREGFSQQDVLFTCVGRLEPVKNHRLLIDAFASAADGIRHVHLLLAGDGVELAHLTEQAHRLGLEHRVHFLGVRSDIPALLAASDVFVFASDHEGSPLSLMEAMAAGLPIAGTAVGGVPGMVPENAGILVCPRDPASLGRALTNLYLNVEQRVAMARAAADHAASFDVSKMATGYERLYTQLCAGKTLLDSGLQAVGAAAELHGEGL